MIVLDDNFALACGPGTDYHQIHIFKCMLERTDAIMNDVLEPFTFVLAYPTVFPLSLCCFPSVHNTNKLGSRQYHDKFQKPTATLRVQRNFQNCIAVVLKMWSVDLQG